MLGAAVISILLYTYMIGIPAQDANPFDWRRIWLVLPYPLLWLAVTLLRGATDGWVP